MKAVLKFNLKDNDSREEFLRCVKATDLALVLWDLYYNTRKGIEEEIDSEKLTADGVLEKLYDKLRELMDEHGIIIDELIS